MKLPCPFCQHGLRLDNPMPGRYAPKCPKCRKKLVITIHSSPDKAPEIALFGAIFADIIAGTSTPLDSIVDQPASQLQVKASDSKPPAPKTPVPKKLVVRDEPALTKAVPIGGRRAPDPGSKPPSTRLPKEVEPAKDVERAKEVEQAKDVEQAPNKIALPAKPTRPAIVDLFPSTASPAADAPADAITNLRAQGIKLPELDWSKGGAGSDEGQFLLLDTHDEPRERPRSESVKPAESPESAQAVDDDPEATTALPSEPPARDEWFPGDDDLRSPTPAAEPAATAPGSGSAIKSAHPKTKRSPGADEATLPHVPSGDTGSRVERRSATPDDAEATGSWASAPTVRDMPDTDQGPMPERLGGYQIVRELGRGAMGSVYLARQLSLDRPVAVKTMRREWADDPAFVARFTREAYAAAQLTHHNVVQIHDIGIEQLTNYFSMEFVDGVSLQQLIEKHGRIPPEKAVGYIMQAARGLKIAHEQGLVHRDVKPANLMLNKHNVVKVADLGLVKVPDAGGDASGSKAPMSTKLRASAESNITMLGTTMGTPAYMSPEQADDSATVDARADIYSLGCTLYALLTGKPPFQGKSSRDVISSHQHKPMIPPDVVVRGLPKQLSDIVLRMTGKQLHERYQSMDEVIAALEDYLGLESDAPFRPRMEHAAALDDALQKFQQPGLLRARRWVMLTFWELMTLLLIVSTMSGSWLTAGAAVGISLIATLSHFVIAGQLEKRHVWLKIREYLLTSAWTDWLKVAVSATLAVLVLYVLGWLWLWLAISFLAIGLGVAFHFVFDTQLTGRRAEPLRAAEKLMRTFRMQGLDEDAVRQFVCEASGSAWEEFYEALFGFESKLAARAKWGAATGGKSRPKFAAWREPLLDWLEARQESRRLARERRLLQKVEQKSLTARGVSPQEARQQAELAAQQLLVQGARTKQALQPAKYRRSRTLEELQNNSDSGGWLDLLLGATPRFVVGAALVAASGLWLHQNNLLSADKLQKHATQAYQQAQAALKSDLITDLSVDKLKQAADQAATAVSQGLQRAQDQATAALSNPQQPSETPTITTRPLRLPLLPAALCAVLGSFGAGGAGLLLLLSSAFRGVKMTLFIVPAAALAIAGPLVGIPPLGIGAEWVSLAAAGLLGLIALLFGRSN